MPSEAAEQSFLYFLYHGLRLACHLIHQWSLVPECHEVGESGLEGIDHSIDGALDLEVL